MAKSSNGTIQPVAFTLKSSLINQPIAIETLAFPDAWRGLFAVLHTERGSKGNFEISSLNSALAAQIQHLAVLPNQVKSNRSPWLLALQRVPVEAILQVTQAWLSVVYGSCSSYAKVYAQMHVDDLEWKTEHIVLDPNGQVRSTTDPDPLAFNVVPALLAASLAGTSVPIFQVERKLVRVPVESGAELMTWPPVYVASYQGDEFGYSYTVRITLQTMAGQTEPRVHIHYGVRRWISTSQIVNGSLMLRSGRRAVYLHAAQTWYGMSPTEQFGRAAVTAVYNNDRRVLEWDGHLAEIISVLDGTVPDAANLAESPRTYLDRRQGVVAAMVRKSEASLHSVMAGVSFSVHRNLTQRVALALAEKVALVPQLDRLSLPRKVTRHPLSRDLLTISPDDRQRALFASVGQDVHIEIRYTTERWRDWMFAMALQQLGIAHPDPVVDTRMLQFDFDANLPDVLDVDKADDNLAVAQADAAAAALESECTEGVQGEALVMEDEEGDDLEEIEEVTDLEVEPPPARDVYSVSITGGARLTITCEKLGKIGALLPEPDGSLTKGFQRASYRRSQTEARIKQIVAEVPAVKVPTLTLVEMPNYRARRYGAQRGNYTIRDPKRALRRGLAATRRVSKFMDVEHKDEIAYVAKNSIREGLRQLGYLPASIGYSPSSGHGLPDKLLIAAVWIVRLNRKRSWQAVEFPVVVVMQTDGVRVGAWLPDGKPVRTFQQALCDLALLQGSTFTSEWKNREMNLKALRHFLVDDLPRIAQSRGNNDVLILADAQNARSVWPGLANGQFREQAMVFSKDDVVQLDQINGCRMRLIRLRTSERNETPEWFAAEPGSGAGYLSGLWCAAEKPATFYNIAYKPRTMQSSGDKDQFPNKHYALPSILEIVLTLQPDDDPLVWAQAIKEWRDMSYQTNDMTLRPLPLEFARSMERYGEVILPWVIPDLWESDGELDDDEDDEDGSQPRRRVTKKSSIEQQSFDF